MNHNGHSLAINPLRPFSEDGRAAAGSSALDTARSAAGPLPRARPAPREHFAFSPEGCLVTDLHGVIHEANQAVAAMLQVRKEFLIDKPLALLVGHERRRAFYTLLLQLQKDVAGVREWQAPLRYGRGEVVEAVFWVAGAPDEAGRATALRWLLRDVTRLAVAERALLAERGFAQGILDTAQVIVLVVEGDRILRCNPHLRQLTGVEESGLLGKLWQRLLPDGDRRAAEEMVREALAHRAARRCRTGLLTRIGPPRRVEWSAVPFGQGDAAAQRVLVVGHDITELEEAQQQALQAERLAAIGRVMASLAHESRNLLQHSQACLERLSWKLQDQPQALELIGRLQRSQKELTHLLEDVRGYAAPLRLERAPCDMREVLRQAWEEVQSGYPDREAALLEVGEADAVCQVDRFRLLQVFRNLLDNSFMACTGTVRVWARWTEGEQGTGLRVSLRDNGPGLSPDQRHRLFEPFYTTRRHGSGLGLAISRRIVQAHGGDITVAGACGEGGAEFIIHLPRNAS